ncbi:MAG: hypothetical protein NWQ23_14405 [Yoonia sp.]|uniref:hypothetical protein n=1 Tax=Yoonia sp. TaxID=2212373 RepID=UPI00273F800E|nr:hypothetical protein [Yoonia sp.]MDP5086606.1 hypothetical protein [Yoonia sp.]
MSKKFKIGVQSAPDYDELFAEIEVLDNFAIVVSEEREIGNLDVAIFSKDPCSWDNYIYSKYDEQKLVSLDELIEALESARSKLANLKRRVT